MRPSFYPRLVNPPFGDPAVYVPFAFEKRALLFDIGDIHSLSPKDIQKISHIFVSHTHMDHFIGFDHLVRLLLGREKSIHLFGPKGFMAQVQNKLAGYSWNLVENYPNAFQVHITEIDTGKASRLKLVCSQGFQADGAADVTRFDGTLVSEPQFTVTAKILDHGLPCLGFALKERLHVNILKDRLDELGLTVGPWLNTFKQAMYRQADPQSLFTVDTGNCKAPGKQFTLGELSEKIAIVTAGQKLVYIADAVFNEPNIDSMIELVNSADIVFIETAFLEADALMAHAKHHLTARQAGEIAGRAGAGMLVPFHFSPRYTGMAHELYQEAMAAFECHKKQIPARDPARS